MKETKKNNARTNRRLTLAETQFRKAMVTLMCVATIIMGFTSLVITGTQLKMADYHEKIQTAEDSREEAKAEVADQIASGAYPSIRIQHTQSLVDGYDNDVEKWSAKRESLENSSFFIIRWAAKDDFEASILAIGIGIFVAIVAMWVVAIKWTDGYFFVVGLVFKPLFWLIRFTFFGIFSLLETILSVLKEGFHNLANKVKPGEVFPNRFKATKSAKIIPYDERKRA